MLFLGVRCAAAITVVVVATWSTQAFGDGAKVQMSDWTPRCAARLERARSEMARTDESFSGAKVKVERDAVVLSVERGTTIHLVRITVTSPRTPERNNWNPPLDKWIDLPIIDKAYTTLKLNLFRWSTRLQGSIMVHRADTSRRAPPVPAWLERFVAVFKPAVEDCLNDGA